MGWILPMAVVTMELGSDLIFVSKFLSPVT
jgi:hypothetical protein